MKILLVEDEGPKGEKLKECLSAAIPHVEILHAKSVRSAISLLDEQNLALVILDMSLPTFDISEDEYGGTPQGYGGLEVMREMQNYEINVPVVVVTAYEYFPENDESESNGKEKTLPELRSELEQGFPEIFVELIKYDTYSDEWQELLTACTRDTGVMKK